MAVTLDMRAAEFEPRFRALLAAKREASVDVDARGGRDHRRRAGARRRGADRLHAALRSRRPVALGLPHRAGRDRGGGRRLRSRGAGGAGARPRAGARLSPPPAPRRRFVRRPLGRPARLALARDRRGRPLRARRHGELSIVGDHERRAGGGRRLPAPRHGRADARRQAQSLGARRGQDRGGRAKSTASAAPRRSPRSPTEPRASRRSSRSSAPATPMSRRPSGGCSASSAST